MPIQSPIDLMRQHGINLLLLGLPKCGTTAFADWLAASAEIDVSNPKETFLLCPEFADNLKRTVGGPLADCFSTTHPGIRMEASTLNVFSESAHDAANGIDDVKCVLLVRDPVEVATSWHNQMKQAGLHRHESFLDAWREGCRSTATAGPDFLQRYDQICSHGFWVNRWLQAIGHERCLVLPSTSLMSHANAVKKTLEAFLARELTLREHVAERNAFSQPRNKQLYTALRTSSVKSLWSHFERSVPAAGHVRRFVRDRVLLKKVVKSVDPEITRLITTTCEEDQALLQRLLIENRSHWPLAEATSVVGDPS